jgi:hypothetical protein
MSDNFVRSVNRSSCGNTICLGNGDYEPLLREVKHTLQEIDCASLAAVFGGRNPLH